MVVVELIMINDVNKNNVDQSLISLRSNPTVRALSSSWCAGARIIFMNPTEVATNHQKLNLFES